MRLRGGKHLFSTYNFLQDQIGFKEAYVRVVIISNTYSHSFSSHGLKSLWVIHSYSTLNYVASLKETE